MRSRSRRVALAVVCLLAALLLWRQLASDSAEEDQELAVRREARTPAGAAADEPAAGDAPSMPADLQPIHVRVLAQGRPVAGARVAVYAQGPGEQEVDALAAAETGQDGAASFSVAADRPLFLFTHARGYAQEVRSLEGIGAEPFLVDLAPGHVLEGRVEVRGTGAPVGGASVYVHPRVARPILAGLEPPFDEIAAGADGRFRVEDLAAGTYELSASADGRHSEEIQIEIPSRGEALLEVEELVAVEGLVLDVSGLPAVGATVAASESWSSRSATTDSSGAFQLFLRPGSHRLSAALGSLAASAQPVTVLAGRAVAGVVLRLAHGGELTLNLRDSAGAPVAEAEVSLESAQLGGERQATSGPDGSVDFFGLLPGSYKVTVQAPGFDFFRREGLTLLERQRAEFDFELVRQGALEGQVLDSREQPVSGATIRLESEYGTVEAVARSDASGRFSLRKVAPGRFKVRARHEPSGGLAMAEVQVAPGQTAEARLVLAPSAILTGRILDSEGRPLLESREVVASAEPGQVWTASAHSADGQYLLELCPGAYEIAVDGIGLDRAAGRVALRAGERATLDLRFETGRRVRGSIAGTVFEPDGAPSAGATVTVYMGGSGFAVADPQGRFRIQLEHCEDCGAVSLSARNEGRNGSVDEVAVGSEGVELRLSPGGSIAGRVLGEPPVEGFVLSTSSLESDDLSFFGDRFQLPERAPGSVSLRVRVHDGRIGSAQVELKSGERAKVEIRVGPAASLSGQAVDGRSGRPLEREALSVVCRELRLSRTVQTDESGRFSVGGLAPGSYRVEAEGSDLRGGREVSVEAGGALDIGVLALEPAMAVHPCGRFATVRSKLRTACIERLDPAGPAAAAGVRVGDCVAFLAESENALALRIVRDDVDLYFRFDCPEPEVPEDPAEPEEAAEASAPVEDEPGDAAPEAQAGDSEEEEALPQAAEEAP